MVDCNINKKNDERGRNIGGNSNNIVPLPGSSGAVPFSLTGSSESLHSVSLKSSPRVNVQKFKIF